MCSVNEVDFDDDEQCMEKKSVVLYVKILPKCIIHSLEKTVVFQSCNKS